ncbi:alpha-glucosidase [Enterococcus cecorum]|nr:alpha-glucosidase [Enterococcus cecorum]
MDKHQWWQKAVVYQIYPKSFQDSNGDGIGDIQGIINRLDYLKLLGVDVIWLSPIYKSPNYDNGYDISNYYEIGNEYGDMKDFERLVKEAESRGIKIIMDLVLSHTSDEHEWFIESRKNKNNKYREYYFWRKGSGEFPPNELKSFFGGTAWKYDSLTNEYYLHLFSEKQPDLNWNNEQLRKELYTMIEFWIKKGVYGFRLDVIELIAKDPDNLITGNGPKLHEYIRELNNIVFKDNLLTVGETGSATPEIAKLYTDENRQELSMIFHFEHMSLDEEKRVGKSKWDIKELNVNELKKILSKWQFELNNVGWNSLYWSNHDQPRIVSRWGDTKKYHLESAKMFAIILHTMKGTPYIYQGEELGMTNRQISDISQVKDIESLNIYYERLSSGYSKEEILDSINKKGRDNARTPMQWDDSKNAGFTTGTPWLEVNDNYKKINVKKELKDKNSIFYTYQKLISIRKSNNIVVYGDFQDIESEYDEIYSFMRILDNQKWVVIANISTNTLSHKFDFEIKKMIITNYKNIKIQNDTIILRPYEALVVEI